jgi:hypothetical protein
VSAFYFYFYFFCEESGGFLSFFFFPLRGAGARVCVYLCRALVAHFPPFFPSIVSTLPLRLLFFLSSVTPKRRHPQARAVRHPATLPRRPRARPATLSACLQSSSMATTLCGAILYLIYPGSGWASSGRLFLLRPYCFGGNSHFLAFSLFPFPRGSLRAEDQSRGFCGAFVFRQFLLSWRRCLIPR